MSFTVCLAIGSSR